ncbi:MAG: hypothetical protein JWO08_46, partial [Verrucomicrobiaceae bacterium]|nr:hypothetical protein [Verrucomicrobiaceae bacterium]
MLGWDPSVGDTVLFFQPVIGWQEGGAYEASLGLALRKVYDDPTHGRTKLANDIDLLGEGWFIGGSLFVDGMRSAHDQNHCQLSTGLEIGSRYLTLRANYFVPLTDAKRWGKATSTEVSGQSRTRRKNYELSVGPVVTSGPAAGTHDIHVTTTPFDALVFRENRFTYGLYDEALRGWDTELSVLVPVIDKHVDLRLVAGLYGFDGGSTSRGFQGWQVGAEFRPVPAVVLMATRFNDDRNDGGQWMAGVRVEIPLGTRSPDAFRMRERRLSERLMEPVGRRYSPTVASGTKLEKKTVTTTTVTTNTTPRTIEGLVLPRLPAPGDVIQLQDGTLLVLEADGKTLRPLRRGEGIYQVIMVVPEPSRVLLALLGLTSILLRRRRSYQ